LLFLQGCALISLIRSFPETDIRIPPTAVSWCGLRCASSVKFLSALSERHIVRHRLKVASNLVLLYRDRFEEQGLTAHVDIQKGDFPMTGCDFGSASV
jgi:hypothetical protein